MQAMDVDDILVLVLERIDCHVSLIRAATTCRRWRRVIAGAAFLRRYRSLHRPAVAGHYHNDGRPLTPHRSHFGPWRSVIRGVPQFVLPSSSSSPTTVNAGHFSLHFLPPFGTANLNSGDWLWYDATPAWKILDSRGSLLLMVYPHCSFSRFGGWPDIVVCEPLTRRYKAVPPPPSFGDGCYGGHFWGPYLLDGEDDDDDAAGGRIGMANFRVLCVLCRDDDGSDAPRAAVFAGGDDDDGEDSAAAWSEKAIDEDHITSGLHPTVTSLLGRAGGSWYFYVQGGTLVVLDGGAGEFTSSSVTTMLPPATIESWDRLMWTNSFYVTDGRDDYVDGGCRPLIFTVADDELKVFARSSGNNGGEWALEKKVLVSKVVHGLTGYDPSLFTQPVSSVVTRGTGFVTLSPHGPKGRWRFSVDLDTYGEDEDDSNVMWLPLGDGGLWLFSINLETMEAAPAAEHRGAMLFRCELPWPPVLLACLDG